jgi:hypothetical protein
MSDHTWDARAAAAKKLADRRFRWETFKALATILTASAVISGTAFCLNAPGTRPASSRCFRRAR